MNVLGATGVALGVHIFFKSPKAKEMSSGFGVVVFKYEFDIRFRWAFVFTLWLEVRAGQLAECWPEMEKVEWRGFSICILGEMVNEIRNS